MRRSLCDKWVCLSTACRAREPASSQDKTTLRMATESKQRHARRHEWRSCLLVVLEEVLSSRFASTAAARCSRCKLTMAALRHLKDGHLNCSYSTRGILPRFLSAKLTFAANARPLCRRCCSYMQLNLASLTIFRAPCACLVPFESIKQFHDSRSRPPLFRRAAVLATHLAVSLASSSLSDREERSQEPRLRNVLDMRA